jgi:hypothetical protein
MYQHHSWTGIARQVLSLILWATQRVLRVLLRRPIIDVLLWLLVLWLIAGFIGNLLAPQPVLYRPAAVFEGR